MLVIEGNRLLILRRSDRTTVHSQKVTFSTKNRGKVNLTLGDWNEEKNLGPEMCGATGVQVLERQENSSVVKGSLPRRLTTVKSHSEPSLLLRHLPFLLSRDGDRPRSGASSGSRRASFWRLSAAFMRFTASSSK